MREIVYVIPFQTQEIADAQSCVDAQDNEAVVAEFSAVQIVVREFLYLMLVSDRFCDSHKNSPPFQLSSG
jgi:hypothetical protein